MTTVVGAGMSLDRDPRSAAVAAGTLALQGLGDRRADLAVVFCAGDHLAAPEQVLDGVHEALAPGALIGCSAGGVLSGRLEVEAGTATSVWAASFDDAATVETFHCESEELEDGPVITGLPDLAGASALVLLPDPLSFPLEAALQEVFEAVPGVPVLGGLASARTLDGQVALFHDREVVSGGAVGVRFAGAEVLAFVSQGAMPIGPELTVTAAEGNVILELAGKPALQALQAAIEELDTVERALVTGGLLIGIVADPDKPEYRTGDFLVRGLLGADPASGAVALGYPVREGQVVRLHARDAGSADRDMRDLLSMSREALGGRTPAGALVFTCNGRGAGMFGTPGHDAEAVADELGEPPAAGFFAAGEIGPVGGVPELHGFTATMALFA